MAAERVDHVSCIHLLTHTQLKSNVEVTTRIETRAPYIVLPSLHLSISEPENDDLTSHVRADIIYI